ncbi:hypothetical protein BO94DRAFT_565647 [Aspergillus sclerotioniger CBS 115572]|uniref:Mid2 domain-containing protein n=1 Tax=Aspergillus sclerotioniger CBS 115572 TaxID=1450535 RepID=A0A317WS39_9EURO|nr:hypothetical protein BO94DRAFT_565647 [Aspergillus sclerotioniger CBS 115572]PWY88845.1 hypothetical protein BO94DRAFT_565647 [Aspergillus sclerotioniger CBS 115572]
MSTSCYALHEAIAGNGPSPNLAYMPCGVTNSTHPYVNCCRRGDYCMRNALCHYTMPNGQDGYYSAGCTDPKMQDPACMTRCGGRSTDATYVTAELWACCMVTKNDKGDPIVTCSNHTQEIFPAPAPSDLVTLQYIPITGTPTYATANSTAAPIASVSNGLSNSSASSNSSGSDIGAAAGIGVGVAAAILLIAMAIAFLFFRRRVHARSKAPRPESDSTAPIMPHTGFYSAWMESTTNMRQPETRYELPRGTERRELH